MNQIHKWRENKWIKLKDHMKINDSSLKTPDNKWIKFTNDMKMNESSLKTWK